MLQNINNKNRSNNNNINSTRMRERSKSCIEFTKRPYLNGDPRRRLYESNSHTNSSNRDSVNSNRVDSSRVDSSRVDSSNNSLSNDREPSFLFKLLFTFSMVQLTTGAIVMSFNLMIGLAFLCVGSLYFALAFLLYIQDDN